MLRFRRVVTSSQRGDTMKHSKTKKRISHKQQKLLALQVQEHIERYHPEMKGSEIVISPCGTFASVRDAQKTGRNK